MLLCFIIVLIFHCFIWKDCESDSPFKCIIFPSLEVLRVFFFSDIQKFLGCMFWLFCFNHCHQLVYFFELENPVFIQLCKIIFYQSILFRTIFSFLPKPYLHNIGSPGFKLHVLYIFFQLFFIFQLFHLRI